MTAWLPSDRIIITCNKCGAIDDMTDFANAVRERRGDKNWMPRICSGCIIKAIENPELEFRDDVD